MKLTEPTNLLVLRNTRVPGEHCPRSGVGNYFGSGARSCLRITHKILVVLKRKLKQLCQDLKRNAY